MTEQAKHLRESGLSVTTGKPVEFEDCYSCAYKGTNPGSAHIRCNFGWMGSGLTRPAGKSYGVKHGWWIFPLSFDPVWMVGQCLAWSEVADPAKLAGKPDPMAEMLAILASVGRF